MIYLNNNTNQQECWIPRQDVLSGHSGSKIELEGKTVVISADTTNVYPSIGYDGMSAVTVDATEYAQQNYDGGFEDGFSDGYASGSTDGFESGYTSGYTSGETHQKSLLVSTAFTENGEYRRENGYLAITVNVPTGQTYNVEENHPFTATSNGNYTITPSSGQTTIRIGYDDGVDFYFTASTYPSVGYFEIGTIEFYDRNDEPFGSVDIYYNNGQIDYDDSDWDESIHHSASGTNMLYVGFDKDDYSDYVWREGEDFSFNYDVMSGVSLNVNVPQTGSSLPLSSITISANTAISVSDKAYTGITVNVDTASTYNSGYTDGENAIIGTFSSMTATTNGVYGSSAHPLSSITVDVTTTASYVTYVEYLETDGSEISWDTGVKLENPSEIVYFDFAPLSGNATGDAYFPFLSQQYNDIVWNLAIRTIGGGYKVYGIYQTRFGNASSNIQYSVGNKNVCVISVTGATVNGVDYLQQATGLYTVNWNIIINGQKTSDGFMRFPVARYYGFKIMSGDNAVIDLKPALDGNDVPCFYDEVSKTYIYHTGSGTPISGPVLPSPDYQSGYTSGFTDGYNTGYTSGYTDGQDSIISTFTAITATTNGVYGSSANPLSSITVNVPQTGSSAVLGVGSFSANGTYSASTDSLDGYSAITINVSQTGGSGTTKIFLVDYIHTETIPINDAEINTGIYASTDISVRIKGVGKGYQIGERGDNIFGFGPVEGASDYNDFRLMCYDNNTVLAYDWRGNRIYKDQYAGLYDGRVIDYTCSNYYVYDNLTEEYVMSGNTQTSVNTDVPIYVNVGKWWLKSIEIWKGQTKVFDGVAAYDENGNIGLYDSVSKELVYNSNLQMAYEIIQRSYTIDDLARRNYNIADPTINVTVMPHSFQNAGLTGQLTLTNAVSNVYTWAFYGNPITGITWPTSTIWINGPFCFSECGLQGKLVIPANVRFSLVDTTFSFYNCTGITSVEFYANSGNPVVPKECFSSCENITDVDLYDVSTIKQEAFYGCSTLTLINVHSTVAPVIEDYTCFSGISSSGTVHYPSGSDYSSWQNDTNLSGWTFVSDL